MKNNSFDPNTNRSNPDDLSHPNANKQSESVPVDETSNPKRKNRKLKGTDTPTAKEEETIQKLNDFIAHLPQKPLNVTIDMVECRLLLMLLLHFLKIVLIPNIFRYFLGLISAFTGLTNKEVAMLANCSPKTVSTGRSEVCKKLPPDIRHQRKKGGGRKSLSITNPKIAAEILRYAELRAYGACTQTTNTYTAASLEDIRQFILRKYNTNVSCSAIRNLLIQNHYSPHKNKKLLYGNQASETEAQRIIRHEQFNYIYKVLLRVYDPDVIVLSGDCKKKEALGNFAQNGKSWSKDGIKCFDHDFRKPLNVKNLTDLESLMRAQEGTAIPYGVYDIAKNKCYFSVGITHDTAEFVEESIWRFFDDIRADHPNAKMLYLLCDGGGSNSATHYDFKFQMQRLAIRIGMPVHVVHYPPYRSKFNKIERHVFAYVSKRFERQPIENLAKMIQLLTETTTKKGLKIFAQVDTNYYPLKEKPTSEQMNAINIKYVGPTKNEKTKLSYIIDEYKLDDGLFPRESSLKTVFDLKDEMNLAKQTKKNQKQKTAKTRSENAKKAKDNRKKQTAKVQSEKAKKPKKPSPKNKAAC